jgi:hypothetical protein
LSEAEKSHYPVRADRRLIELVGTNSGDIIKDYREEETRMTNARTLESRLFLHILSRTIWGQIGTVGNPGQPPISRDSIVTPTFFGVRPERG